MAEPDRPLIAGRYRLFEELGRGGAGAVWRAHDERLGRPVAVKEVRIPGDDPERVRTRVQREARAAARLRHPSVTAVYDVVEGERTVHLVMELVDGPSLAQHVRRHGTLRPAEAARLGLDLLAALRAAHAQGVVHRDVKPGNVLLPADGPPKLTDFGIAAVDDDASLTATGTVLGSPAYMSPEQARGRGVGPASDLWSLGALLHFAVEGAGPFDRGEAMPTLAAVLADPPAPPQHAGTLAPVLAALLRKDPAERPEPAALERMLREVTDGPGAVPTAGVRPARSPATAPAVASPPSEGSGTGGWAGPDRAPAATDGGRRSGAAALVVGALAVLLVIGALVTRPWEAGGPPTRDPSASPAATAPAPDPTAAPEQVPEPDPAETDGPAPQEEVPPTPEDEPEPPAGEPDAQGDEVGGAEELPAGWTRSAIGPAGASVAHPGDWQEVRVSDTVVDHRAGGGTYVRTDWTDTPAADPLADWERQSAAFAQRREGYEQRRLEATTVGGHDAAVWEYTYVAGGTRLHAVNVNILAPPYAYAVNVQARADAWDELQPTVEGILDSFRAAPS